MRILSPLPFFTEYLLSDLSMCFSMFSSFTTRSGAMLLLAPVSGHVTREIFLESDFLDTCTRKGGVFLELIWTSMSGPDPMIFMIVSSFFFSNLYISFFIFLRSSRFLHSSFNAPNSSICFSSLRIFFSSFFGFEIDVSDFEIEIFTLLEVSELEEGEEDDEEEEDEEELVELSRARRDLDLLFFFFLLFSLSAVSLSLVFFFLLFFCLVLGGLSVLSFVLEFAASCFRKKQE